MSTPTPELPASRRPRIGVFVEWFADGYSDPILNEVVAVAGEQACDVVCFVGGLDVSDYPTVQSRVPLQLANPGNIDAALIVSLGAQLTATQVANSLGYLQPLPMVSMAVQWSEYPSVEIDNQSGVRRGVRHLIKKHGRRYIACLRGPASSTEADKRFEAYRETLEQEGVPFDQRLVKRGAYIRPNGAEAVRYWLEQQLEFDAIVAANDAMALGAIDELKRHGIAVPEQVSVLGFDDIDEARHCQPALTTVRQPMRDHARAAFSVLMDQLQGKEVLKKTILGSELVVRRSCGCLIHHAGSISAAPEPISVIQGESAACWALRLLAPLVSLMEDCSGQRDEGLTDAFVLAITKGERQSLLSLLENQLGYLSEQGMVLRFFQMLQLIQREIRSHAPDAVRTSLVQDLMFDIGILVSEVTTRSEAKRRYQSEARFVDLVRTDEALLTAIDLASLQAALLEHLGRFGIKSLFVCLYDDANHPTRAARLIVACDVERPLELPEKGRRFPATQLLPSEYWPQNRSFSLLVCPLLRSQGESPGYVLFERGTAEAFVYDGLLDQIGSAYRRIGLLKQLVEEARRREIAERERLEKELQIASRIQTGILPRVPQVDGLDISAIMLPATEVGGDYYDVLPFPGGAWLGIGDVAGHGLPTGLVMLMLQSVVSGLVRSKPDAPPKEILASVNRVLVDNIRRRMRQDEHVTLTLIRYERSGLFSFAGAHEEILICRAKDGCVEHLVTSGMWVGIIDDIEAMTDSFDAQLAEGDVMLLYTDGVTEARNAEGEMFGLERLSEALRQQRGSSVTDIINVIVDQIQSWVARQDDDITLLVARQRSDATYVSAVPSSAQKHRLRVG